MYILEGEQNLASIVNTISDLKNVKFLEIDSIPEQPNINYVLKVNIEKQKIWWEKIEKNNSLEILKEEKIKLSKTKLASYLQENPLYSNVHNNIYDYFQEKGLTHLFYCDGIPVIQIDLPKRKIYKLMKRGVI